MDIEPGRELRLEREGLFIRLVGAFMHRDFAVFDEAVRNDVVLEMPGSSWLAGTHRGHAAFGRHVAGLRQVLRSTEEPTVYLHEGYQMIVRHVMMVNGPDHQVQMTLRIKIRFDAQEKIASIIVEPDDLELFDHVANSTQTILSTTWQPRPLEPSRVR